MFKRVWNSKPIVAVRTVSDVYGIVTMLAAIGGSAIVPAAIFGVIAFLGNASWPFVGLIGIAGYVLALLAILFLLPRMPVVKKQVKDKELKPRFFQLSESLLEFANERDEKAPPEATPQLQGGLINALVEAVSDPQNQERVDYEDETKRQYGERYGSRAGVLLDVAEAREWIKPEERQRLEGNVKGTFTWQGPTTYIREMAQQLERFGHRL